MISVEVLEFLLKLLDSQQLHVGDPNFESVAAIVGRAKRELVQAIAAETAMPEMPDANGARKPRPKAGTRPLSGDKHGVDPAT
jgi:hypothetical protein